MPEMDSNKLKEICSNVIFPASTLARSRMSLIKTINASPDILIAFKYSFWFLFKSVFNTTLVNPTIAFIGVLISWLIFDKNCCFAFTASSAICFSCSALFFAFSNSSLCSLCSCISVLVPIHIFILPSSSFKAIAMVRCHKYFPSFLSNLFSAS